MATPILPGGRPGPRPFRPTVVRYLLPDGSRCRKDTPGAVKHTSRLATWYAKVGGKKVSLETTDEGQAWERLRAMLRRRAEGRAGLRDGYTDAAGLPLADHLDAWGEFLRAKGSGAEHVERLRKDVLRVADLAGWKSVADLTAETALRAADALAEREGQGARTRNHVLSHLKQFSRWCARHGRLRSHVLDALAPRPVEDDLRHERRCPTDEEAARLWSHLYGATAKVRKGMSGPTRALGYKVAMACGLRSSELRALERPSFDLVAATVSVPAAYDKRRRKAVIQLPPWLVDELREHFAAGGGCWSGFPARNAARLILYPDLLAAGVPVTVPGPDGKPLWLDMHSLRVWYCTRMAEQPGIDLKTLMDACRHSSPTLTLKVYAVGDRKKRAAAANQLPAPGQPPAPVAPPVAPGAATTGVGAEPSELAPRGEQQQEDGRRRRGKPGPKAPDG